MILSTSLYLYVAPSCSLTQGPVVRDEEEESVFVKRLFYEATLSTVPEGGGGMWLVREMNITSVEQ